MKNLKYLPLIGTIVATGVYVIASNYFFPVKNEESSSTFDRGSAAELLAQCDMIKKDLHMDSIGAILYAHNRRALTSTEKGKKAIFWVSNGGAGAYYPSGPACVVESNSNGQVVSWKVEIFD